MLRAMRRGLETGLRRLLHGHEGGNSGYGQEAAYGLPRQFPTLPRTTRTPADDADVDDRGDVPRDPERFHELVQPRAPRVR